MSGVSESLAPSVPDDGFRLGELAVNPAVGEIAGRAGLERVDPKVMRVLCVLAAHAGELVTREQLLQAVWGRVAVTDDAISRCIYQLRRHLMRASGDAAAKQLIETLPKRGYRLAATIAALEVAPGQITSAALPHPVRSTGRAIAAVLATVLAIGLLGWGLQMPPESRSAAAPPPASTTARSLQDARAEYLQGRYFYDRRGPGDLQRARRHFLKTVDIDPRHARAWAGLAAVHYQQVFTDPHRDHMTPMREAVTRGLAADPNDPEVALRAGRYYALAGERDLAEHYLERALELGRDDPLLLSVAAGAAFDRGRIEEAIALQRRAVQLHPLGAVYRRNLVSMLLAAGDSGAARAEMFQLKDLSPSAVTAYDRARVAVAQGRSAEAIAIMDAAPGSDPADRDHILALAGPAAGRDAEAVRALAALNSDERWLTRIRTADVYIRDQRLDEAFGLLDEAHDAALAENPALSCFVKSEALASPFVASLRSDPRFDTWLARIEDHHPQRSRLAGTALEPSGHGSR